MGWKVRKQNGRPPLPILRERRATILLLLLPPLSLTTSQAIPTIALDNSAKPDDGNYDTFMFEIIKGEVVKITDKGRLFVQLRGVPVLDDWLQEVRKGKTGDGFSFKESDKVVEDFLVFAFVVTSRDLHCKMVATNGGLELPPIAVEERSSGFNQSQNNSQSFSGNQAKTMVSSWKEEQ
ncbi:unnamed protein product [Musa hybrid cultivar]